MGDAAEGILRSLRENYVPPEAPEYAKAAANAEGWIAGDNARRLKKLKYLDRCLKHAELVDPRRPLELIEGYSDIFSALEDSGQSVAAPVFEKKERKKPRYGGVSITRPDYMNDTVIKYVCVFDYAGAIEHPWSKKEKETAILHELAHASYEIGSMELERDESMRSLPFGREARYYASLLKTEIYLASELNSRRMHFYFNDASWDMIGASVKQIYLGRSMKKIRKKLKPCRKVWERDFATLSGRLSNALKGLEYLETEGAERGITRKHITKLMYAAGPTSFELHDFDLLKGLYSGALDDSRPLSPLEYIGAAADLVKSGTLTPQMIDDAASGNKEYDSGRNYL